MTKTQFLSVLMGAWLAMAATESAEASWWQTYCRNGEGTTLWSEGHDDNKVWVTYRSTGGDARIDRKIEVANPNIEAVQETQLRYEDGNSCKPGDAYGEAWAHSVIYKEVRLRRKSGQPFSNRIVGVSADGTYVSAHLICESQLKDEIPCGPQ